MHFNKRGCAGSLLTGQWFILLLLLTQLIESVPSCLNLISTRESAARTGHLIEQGGWEHVVLPVEYEGPTRTTSIGLLIRAWNMANCCGRNGSTEGVEELKVSLGSHAAAGQPQQRPSPVEVGC